MHYIRWSCGENKTDVFLLFTVQLIFLSVFPLSDAIRTKRLSLGAPRSDVSIEGKEKETERKMKTKNHDTHGVSLIQHSAHNDIFTALKKLKEFQRYS